MFFIYWLISGLLALAIFFHGLSKYTNGELITYIVESLEAKGKDPKKDFGGMVFTGLVMITSKELEGTLERKPTKEEILDVILEIYGEAQSIANTDAKDKTVGAYLLMLCGVFLFGFILVPVSLGIKVYKLLNK